MIHEGGNCQLLAMAHTPALAWALPESQLRAIQNSCVKKLNHSLLNKTLRCLSCQKVSKFFTDRAVKTVVVRIHQVSCLSSETYFLVKNCYLKITKIWKRFRTFVPSHVTSADYWGVHQLLKCKECMKDWLPLWRIQSWVIDIFESSEESDLTCVRVNRYCADSMKPTGNCKMYQIYEGHYFAGIPYPAVRVRDTIPGIQTVW